MCAPDPSIPTVAVLSISARDLNPDPTLWLRLEIEIGFFNGESVSQFLLSIKEALSAAWSALLETNEFSSDIWCDFMSREPKPIFMNDKFFGPRQGRTFKNLNDAEHLENLRQRFLSYLLLTSEVIFDETTMVFLENIGWNSDATWKSRTSGYSRSGVSGQILYTGFANHVQYLEQLQRYRLLHDAELRSADSDEGNQCSR
jgi:hypothetical protein